MREFAAIGLVAPAEVVEWRHHLLPHAYPVYALGWQRAVARVVTALESIRNLDLLGRGGLFFYSHLHDQLGMAKAYVADLRPQQRSANRPAALDDAVPLVWE